MKLDGTNPIALLPCALAAAMLALTLVACEQKPPLQAKVAPPVIEVLSTPEPKAAPVQKPGEPQVAADKDLAARVKTALLTEPALKAHGIDVVARNGTVTLYGTAETRMRREMAATIAMRVDGVKSVDNKLAVVAGS
jgi:hypothetical protein